MANELAKSDTSFQRQTYLYFLEHLLPLISTAHYKHVYASAFLEFKDEPITQVLIQWIRLFPLARMRINDQRGGDRLEHILRTQHTKYSKLPRSSLVVEALEEVLEKLRSESYLQECRDFIQNINPTIQAKEIEID